MKSEENMPIIREKGEKEGLLEAAKMMLVAARTAPKSAGVDDLVTAVIYGEEKEQIVSEMEGIALKRHSKNFSRDANNLHESELVLLVGVKGPKSLGLNCGACGYKSCDAFNNAEKIEGLDFVGPICLFKILDLGIALGSSAKIASLLNVDNRIMYRIGTAAKRLKLLPDAQIIMGIPLSASGKSIFFDR